MASSPMGQKIHPEADPTSRSFDDLTDLLYVVVPQGSGGGRKGVRVVLDLLKVSPGNVGEQKTIQGVWFSTTNYRGECGQVAPGL